MKPPHRRDPVRSPVQNPVQFKVYQTHRHLPRKSRTVRILSSCRTQGELHSSGMMGHTSSSLVPLTQSCSFYRTEPSFRFCTRHLIGLHLILPEHINNSWCWLSSWDTSHQYQCIWFCYDSATFTQSTELVLNKPVPAWVLVTRFISFSHSYWTCAGFLSVWLQKVVLEKLKKGFN